MGSPELLTRPAGALPGRPAGASRSRVVAVITVLATTWLCTAAAMVGWSLLPVLGGWRPYVIVSGSMVPRIAPGDVVCVDPAALAGLRRGQVVVVHDPVRPGRLLAHRVHDIRPDGSLVTKGDANPVPDSTLVPPGGAVGVVRLVVPTIGRLALAREQPASAEWGLVGVTALSAVLLAVLRPPITPAAPAPFVRPHAWARPLRRATRGVAGRPARRPLRRAVRARPGRGRPVRRAA